MNVSITVSKHQKKAKILRANDGIVGRQDIVVRRQVEHREKGLERIDTIFFTCCLYNPARIETSFTSKCGRRPP